MTKFDVKTLYFIYSQKQLTFDQINYFFAKHNIDGDYKLMIYKKIDLFQKIYSK